MHVRGLLLICALVSLTALLSKAALAGPPYETDDPEPVACHHIEVDYAFARQGVDAVPLQVMEVDYGPTENVELSLAGQSGESQIGAALRFVSETKTRPQVSFLPAVTIKSNEPSETFLPLWFQKTTGRWTVFGGGGFSHKASFEGLALTRNFRSGSNAGIEVFREVPKNNAGAERALKFNLGYVAQLNDSHAIMLSAGRSLDSDPRVTFYLGYQFVVAARAHAGNCSDEEPRKAP